MSQDTSLRRSGRLNQNPVTRSQSLSRARVALSVAAMAGLMGTRANAAVTTELWQPTTSAGTDWGTAANWTNAVPSNGTPTGSTYDAKFDSATYNAQPNIAANFVIDALVFGDGNTSTGAITLTSTGASTLQLNDDGSITVPVNTNKVNGNAAAMIMMYNGSGAVTIDANLIENATNAFINNSVNLLTVNGNVALNHSFITAGSGNQTYNGIISGGFVVDTGGSGTVSLNGANINTAGDLLEYGTTLIGISSTGAAGAATSGALGKATTTLGYDGSSTTVTASSSLLTNGGYTVDNSINVGQSTFADNTTGTLTLGGATASSSTYAGAVTLFRGVNLSQVAGGTTTFGGVISNTAGRTASQVPVAITGGGTVAFTAANTYIGNTTITNGSTLQLSGSGSIVSSPTINIGAGSTLDVSQLSGYSLASGQTVAGIGSVLGNLTVASASIIAPGVSSSTNVGNLTIGNSSNSSSLSFNGGSFLNAYLGAPGTSLGSPGNAGLITVDGNLNLPSSGVIKVNLTDNAGAFGQGSAGLGYYELFSYTGSLNNFSPSDFSIVSLPASLNGDVATFTNQNNQIDLQFGAAAESLTWTGAAGNGLWDNQSSNWKNGSTPATYSNPDPVTFTDAGATTITIQTGGVSPTSVTFNNSAATYTFNSSDSNGISGSTGITLNGAGEVILAGSDTLSGAVQINAGMLSLSNSSALGGSIGVAVASGGALQLQGNISTPSGIPLILNGAGLTASPAGALNNLTGSNTYGGPVTLATNSTITSSAGALTLGAGVNNAGHTLTISGPGNVTLNNAGIAGSGALTYSGSGVLTLPAGSTYSGGTTISGGIVNAGGDSALGANATPLAFTSNATLQAGANATIAHPITVGSGVTASFDTNGNDMAVGSIGGASAAGLVKLNGGILSLTGDNTYAGSTVITGGTLQVNPALTVPGAVLQIDASTVPGSPGSVSTISNLGSGGGTFNGSAGLATGALNGRQALSFSKSAGQFLQTVNAYTNTGSAVTVFYVGTQTGAGAYQTLAFIGPNGNTDYSTNGNLLIEGTSSTQVQTYIGGFGASTNAISGLPVSTPLIYDTTINEAAGSTGSSSDVIVNNSGSAALSNASGTAPASTFNINQMAIGGRYNPAPAAASYNGDIGEVLIFNTALSAANRAAVEQYLESKWLGVGTAAGNLPTSSPVSIGSGATLDLNGTSQQVPSVSNFNGAGGTVTNSISAPATLVLAPTSGTSTFGGSIQDGGGPVGLTFAGSGTGVQILNGANAFSGPTSINTATLVLGAGGSLGNTAVTVASGATFAIQASSGSVSIGGSLNLVNGSTLDMTDGALGVLDLTGPGTALKIGSAVGGGATMKFDLSSSGTDEIVVSNSAAVTGTNTIGVNPVGNSLTSGGSYTLISATSGMPGSFQFSNGLTTESITVGSTVYNLSLSNTSTSEDISVQIPGITAIWDGAGSTTNTTVFATGSNWSTNPTVPGGLGTTNNLDTIVFNSSPVNLSPVIDSFRNVQNITFDTANVGAINLTGSTLVLSANGTTQTTSTVTNNQKISVPIYVEGNYTFISNSATNATLTLAGAVGDGGSAPVTITLAGGSTGPNTVSGVISDASGTTFVTKAGTGTWILASSNTYSGDTNINSGILQIVNGALGSSGNVIFNGGTLQYATGANQDLSNQINNSTAPVTIDTNGNTVNYAGSISSSNTAGLTKLGAGSLILSGSNAYQGSTQVNAGALNVNNSSGLPSTTTVTVASGAAMQLSGNVNVSSVALNLSGAGVTAGPAGALDSLNGSNTYGGNITLAANSTLQVDSGSLIVSGNINGSNTNLTLSGAGSGTISGVISIGTGGVTMNGPGTWALSAPNTYTGVTTINGGVLQINSATSMGALPGSAVINSGTLEVTSTFSTPRALSLGTASSTIQVDPGQTYTITGNIGNGTSPGTLNKTGVGTLVLSGSNSYSGGTNITAGTLVAGAPSALGTSTVTLSGSAPTLQILPSPVGPVGFGYAGNIGWKLNTGDANTPASVSSANVLTLTTPANAENRSAFYMTPVPYSNFTASYVYQSGTPGTNTGDGIMFVLQNSSAGPSALGPNGDTDAYGGITNSVAVGWELYGNQGVAQGSNGVLTPYVPTVPAGLLTSADPILVTVTGSAASSVLNMTLTDQASSGTFAGNSYSTSFNLSGSLSSLLGGTTAYVGFTGSTGGANSLQTVSNFSYANPFIGNFSAGNPVAVTTNSTIDVSYAGGATLGSLSIGGNTLSFTNASGSGATLTLGAVNLSGSPTLAPVAGVQVNLGALNDNAAAKTVTIAGAASNAIINLTSPATSFVTGSSIQVSGGTLLVTNTTGSATGSGSVFVQSGAFIGGTGTISGPVYVANGGSLFVGLTNDTPNKSAGVLNIGSGSQLLGSTLLDLTNVSTSDELVVGGGSGSVNLSGGILTITVPNTFALGGGESFQLFDFGSEAGNFSAVNLPALSSGRTWNTSQLYSAGVISINGSSAFNNLLWDNIGTGDGMTWDNSGSAASQNWNNSGTAAGFNTGDFVTFTDANLGKYTVTINGTVLPSSTTVNNSSGAYTFSGGSIGGSGGLTKLGSAALVLSNTNTYTGATNVSGGSLILQSSTALPATNHLIIGSGASVVASTLGTEYAVRLGSLTINGGQLDLTRNALVLHQTGALPAVEAWVASGYNNGAWNGPGIISSTAAADTTHLTALGAIVNDNGSGTPLYGAGGSIAATFDGASPVDGDVLVKYTYYGDANLDGTVDASDYARVDNGYLNHLTGWYNGDFNYDGIINGSDYTLIDNVFNMQGASLADQQVSPSVSIAAEVAGPSAVPEPATLGLLAISSIGLLSRRRRRMS